MKKIITAINNPKLNEELKKEKYIEIIGKDIIYKEGILDILEKEKNIDIIILNENIEGEITLQKLIEKIKQKNEKIKIIIIMEKENIEKEEEFKKEKNIEIYYNNKINLESLIKIIKEKEINNEEEIKKEIENLKKIILENNINNKKIINKEKNKRENENTKKLLKNKILKNYLIINKLRKIKNTKITNDNIKPENNKKGKIINIFGINGSGKTLITSIFGYYLQNKNNKILLIDFNINNPNLHTIFQTKKYSKNINNLLNKKTEKNKNKILKKINNIKFINYKKINNIKNNKKYFDKNFKKEKINLNKINLEKNILEKEEIKNIINNFKIKIEKNLDLISGIELIIPEKIEEKNKINIKINIKNIFEEIRKIYDFTMIDITRNNDRWINSNIIKNSDKTIILLEPTTLGIKGTKELIEKNIIYKEEQERSLHILINKENKYSIDRKIIEKCFPKINIIGTIKLNEKYNEFINNKNKKVLFDKKINKKLIYEIIN